MTDKKDIAQIIGDNESYDEFCNELNRRAAVLDFLALYRVAREDKIVERVKHIIHAKGFLDFKPKQWEMYLTRLLGRCLRHIFAGYQSVEKQRNGFCYTVRPGRGGEYDQYRQILDMRRMIEMDWPWYPYGQDMTRYRNDPQLYWRTRGIADPADVDAMFAAWNQFRARVDRHDRCQMQSNGLYINYGSSSYAGHGYHVVVRPGSYHAYDALLHLKGWMVDADRFLENNDLIFDTAILLQEHNRGNDPQIERELGANREREAEFARERAQALALKRQQEVAIVEAADEQEERELTLGENLFEKLREKGLVE